MSKVKYSNSREKFEPEFKLYLFKAQSVGFYLLFKIKYLLRKMPALIRV